MTGYCKYISFIVGPVGLAFHVCYHILHIWMRQCGAYTSYCEAQLIVWCVHFSVTVTAGLFGVFGLVTPRPSMLAAGIYFGQSAFHTLGFFTACLIIFLKSRQPQT